jgi:hypothetical protein
VLLRQFTQTTGFLNESRLVIFTYLFSYTDTLIDVKINTNNTQHTKKSPPNIYDIATNCSLWSHLLHCGFFLLLQLLIYISFRSEQGIYPTFFFPTFQSLSPALSKPNMFSLRPSVARSLSVHQFPLATSAVAQTVSWSVVGASMPTYSIVGGAALTSTCRRRLSVSQPAWRRNDKWHDPSRRFPSALPRGAGALLSQQQQSGRGRDAEVLQPTTTKPVRDATATTAAAPVIATAAGASDSDRGRGGRADVRRNHDSDRGDVGGWRERPALSGGAHAGAGASAGRAGRGGDCKDAPWGCALCGARNRVGRRRCDLCHAAREVSQPTPPPTGQCPRCRVIGSRGPSGVCMSCGLPFAGHRGAS